jgi:hypothetical protein
LEAQFDIVPPAPEKPAWRPEYDAARKTEDVRLRLLPEDALALRLAAKASALNVSTYVARLVANRDTNQTIVRDEDPLADASIVAAAISQVPNEIRRLRGELLKLGGLVKSLFIRSESMNDAKDHAHECSDALIALTRSAESVVPIVSRVEDELASVRVQLEQIVLGLCDDR